MKILGPRTVYGQPQFSKQFERWLIVGCLLGAAIVLALALTVTPAAAEGNHNGGDNTVAGNRVGNQCCRRNDDGTINRQDAIAYWRGLLEKNNPPAEPPSKFEEFLDRYIGNPIRNFLRPGSDGLRGKVNDGTESRQFSVGYDGNLARGV